MRTEQEIKQEIKRLEDPKDLPDRFHSQAKDSYLIGLEWVLGGN
jgi:hypothetical protein